MVSEELQLDGNSRNVSGGVSSSDDVSIIQLRLDPTTKRLLVDASITSGLGAQTGLQDGEAVSAADYGVLIMGTDGSNYQAVHTDTSGDLQVDVLTMPTTTVQATNLDIRDLTQASDSVLIYGSDDGGTTKRVIKTDASGSIQIDFENTTIAVTNAGTFAVQDSQDVMLGTDFSNVFGTASLILATQADDVANTSDGIQTSSFLYMFDGVTWDRLKGDSTDGVLVNLGSNNDVVVSATNLDIRDLTSASDSVLAYGSDDGGTTKRVLTTDSSGNLQVDILNASIAVTGTFWQATQPVSLASVPSHAVTNAGTFAVQDSQDVMLGTDFSSVFGTGSLLITTQADNIVNTQDTVTTSALLYGFDGTTWDRITNGGGVEATALRVTIASDSTGVLSVDDNGASLSVDWNGTQPVTGSGNATGALRVELPTNGTGTIASITSSVTPGTAAANLGKAEDGTHTTGDVGVMALGVRTDVPNAVAAGTTGEYSFFGTDMAGGLRTALYETDFAVLGTNHVKKYYTNAGAVTDGIIWSPAAGKRWYVTDIYLQVSAAATVTIEDDLAAGDAAIWKAELAANSGWSHSFATPWFSGEDAADLLVTTTAGNIYITVTGYEI